MLAELEGLITTEVGEALAALAADVAADQAIVEIGSYKGKSTCYLASGARAGHGAHVWAVDPWDLRGNVTGRFGFAEPATRRDFELQVRAMGLADQITPVQAFSIDAAAAWGGPPVGLLYIDGDHSAPAVRVDFDAWFTRLAPGAVVAFDDLDTPRNPGVRAALQDLNHDFDIQAERLAVIHA